MKYTRFLIVPLFLAQSLVAEIAFTEIKGLYSAVHDDKKYLSPVNGLNWWGPELIEKMYRFGDDNSASIKLIRELFFLAHDQVTFGPTRLPTNPGAYFDAETIGKLLNALEPYAEKKELSHEEQIKLQTNLSAIITQCLQKQRASQKELDEQHESIKKLENEKKELTNTISLLTTQLKQLKKQFKQQPEKNEIQEKITVKEKEILKTKQTIDTLKLPTQEEKTAIKEQIRQWKRLSEKINPLAHLIVSSLQETLEGNLAYNTTQQILLAYLWRDAANKNDFLIYFNQFDKPIATIDKEDEWIRAQYTFETFKKEKDSLGKNILDPTHYEMNSFLLQGLLFYRDFPAQVRGTMASYLYNNTAYRFPDCGETALRNFFNVLLFNNKTKRFDVTILQNNKKLKPAASLINYYKNHTNISEIETKNYYNDWTYVVSNLRGIRYQYKGDPSYELSAGLSNILKLLNILLLGSDPEFEKLSNEKKLNELVQRLSTPETTITWQSDHDINTHDDDITIILQFKENNIQRINTYEWKFLPNHFIFQFPSAQSLQGTANIRKKMLTNQKHPLVKVNLFPWLQNQSTYIIQEDNPSLFLIYCSSLMNVNTRIYIFDTVDIPDSIFINLIKAALSSYDDHEMGRALRAIANDKQYHFLFQEKAIQDSLKTLQILNFEYMRLIDSTKYNNIFKLLTGLKKLLLANNYIKAIPNNSFAALSLLEKLDLSENKIETITKDTFRGLTNLKELNLSYNAITTIDDDAFKGLFKLEKIAIRDNPIIKNFSEKLFKEKHHLPEAVIIDVTLRFG